MKYMIQLNALTNELVFEQFRMSLVELFQECDKFWNVPRGPGFGGNKGAIDDPQFSELGRLREVASDK